MKKKQRYSSLSLSKQEIHSICDQVHTLADSVLPGDYILIDTELVEESGRWFLRLYIEHNPDGTQATDKSGPIGLSDCQVVSQRVSPLLDEAAIIPEKLSYNLEVSSPGLFRQIRSTREFKFYANRRAELVQKGSEPEIVYIQDYNPAQNQLTVRHGESPDSDVSRLEWNEKSVKLTLAPENIFSALAGTPEIEGEPIL